MSHRQVSVVMAAYNHERYIREAVESVLSQTFPDLEAIVVNDGSTDGTASILDGFRDPRLKVIHQGNSGVCRALNRGLAEAQGRFVALMSGDDVCVPHRLETQLREYASFGRCALFSCVEYIDENSAPLASSHWASPFFNVEPMSRAQIVRRLFTEGNFLNAVTFFTERENLAAETLAGRPVFDPRWIQLQDYELWIRLIRRLDFRISRDKLIRYRIRPGWENLSAPHPKRVRRTRTEHYLILKHHLSRLPDELFREAFAGDLIHPGFSTPIERKCEEAFLALRGRDPYWRLLGIEMLSDLLGEPESSETLERQYHFDPLSFADLTLKSELFSAEFASTLYWDSGSGFAEKQSVAVPSFPDPGEFEIEFEVPKGAASARKFRWDPFEGLFMKLEIKSIELSASDGTIQSKSGAELTSNGRRIGKGSRFDLTRTLDPMIFFAADKECARVRIRGEAEIWDYRQIWRDLTDRRFLVRRALERGGSGTPA